MLQALAILAAAVAVHAAPAVQWTAVGRADGDEVIEFSAALPQRNLDVLENVLLDVSDPESVNYGLYPDAASLNEMTRPDAAVFDEVRRFLEAEPATACRVMPSSLRCRSTVEALERTLATEFTTYQHPTTGDLIHRVPRDSTYTIPDSLKGKLTFLSGLTGFPIEHYGTARPLSPEASDPTVIPATLVNMYSLSSAKGSSQVTVAAAEFQNYPAYGDSDLATFIKQAAVTPFTIAKKIGPFNGNDPQAESSLDVQYIGATGVGCTNWYVTEAQWMYDFSENIVASPSTYPSIMSMSYGWSEADQCQISPSSPPCKDGSAAFVQAVNANFLKYSTSGHTLFASSGDSGAHGRTDPTCQDPKTRPAFPAASPYVTAVGATQLDTSSAKTGGSAPICSSLGPCAESGTEIVASPKTGALVASGGGFSNVAPMPAWAHAAQTAYQQISGACPPSGDYNASGRGFPDVAALGHNYYIQLQGQAYHVDGTSCSSPVWAGVLSLINSYELSKGRSAIGFLNPTLYKLPASAFNDVTSGNNYCTENTCSCTTGFTAEKGWDATTGFGTPNYEGITAALDAFAAKRAAVKFARGE